MPPSKRNKLLHRFYEPLVLLHVLDRIQGDHVPRQREDSLPPDHALRTALRRRFLESLAYVCDYEKGGDTTAAIFVSTAPLTYNIASNKLLPEGNGVVPFLDSLLKQLGTVTHGNFEQERRILEKCVLFSEKRIMKYWGSLQNSLNKCQESTSDVEILHRLNIIKERLFEHCALPVDLCTCCFELMKSELLNFVKDKATKSEDFGNKRSPFADLRHFIGRLGNHVQVVKVLVVGAKRFPGLIEDFQIQIVNGPSSPILPPPTRNKLTLAGIANRMTNCNEELRKDIEDRLVILNDALEIERLILEEYGEKSLKPRVHAELVLLEYFYRNRHKLQFADNDRYIGSSKPACYCCYLYIREHPGGFAQPATHQKIYLNWLPPTSNSDVQEPLSETAVHERMMLNSMVREIRRRAIEQLKAKTGGERRQWHCDSVTWETLPSLPFTASQDGHNRVKPSDTSGNSSIRTHSHTLSTDAELSTLLEEKISLVDGSDDSEAGGGVRL